MNKLEKIISNSKRNIIAIDGRCGAGKTTLANNFKDRFNVEVLHLDDFFLPLELGSDERFLEIGGNIHRERLFSEVFNNINEQINYRKYCCKTGVFSEIFHIDTSKTLIIEGAYSLLPCFYEFYDYRIFMDIDEKIQKERIIERNGVDGYQIFQQIWIPKEENYIKEHNIMQKVDFIL